MSAFPRSTGPHRSRGENHERHREKILQMCSSLDRTPARTHKKKRHTNSTSVLLEKNSTAGFLSPSGGLKCQIHTGSMFLFYVLCKLPLFVLLFPKTFARKIIHGFLLLSSIFIEAIVSVFHAEHNVLPVMVLLS